MVFEGIDGSGKTAQFQLLKDYVKERGIKNTLFTFEHTRNTEWSQKIEEIINGQVKDVPMDKIQLLYILDRKEHIEKVLSPALKKGMIVFCDRYFLSTLAYGCLDQSIHWKTLWNNHKEIIGNEMILPSKTIFFDIPAELATERLDKNRDSKTIFESLEKLRKVRENYISIGKNFEGFEIIDGSGSPEQVFNLVKEKLAGII